MIKIDEFFEKYPDNIIGFRVNRSTKIIDFWLNSDWDIPKQLEGVSVKMQKNDEQTHLTYYIIFTDSFDFNHLYQSVSNIIEYNLDIERKQTLFKDKLNELKTLFTTLSYEELKSIHFDTQYSLNKNNISFEEDYLVSSETNNESVNSESDISHEHGDNNPVASSNIAVITQIETE